jgi:hypothetical protein
VLGALVVSRNMDPMFGAIEESADLLQCDGSVYSAPLIMYPTCTSSAPCILAPIKGSDLELVFLRGQM